MGFAFGIENWYSALQVPWQFHDSIMQEKYIQFEFVVAGFVKQELQLEETLVYFESAAEIEFRISERGLSPVTCLKQRNIIRCHMSLSGIENFSPSPDGRKHGWNSAPYHHLLLF